MVLTEKTVQRVVKEITRALEQNKKSSKAAVEAGLAKAFGCRSFNALLGIVKTSGPAAKTKRDICQRCDSLLGKGYCIDESCPYSDWPQVVAHEDLCVMNSVELFAKYGVKKRVVEEDYTISPALSEYFCVEMRNEEMGGVAPATLGSALESLYQMPEDVYLGLNPAMAKAGADYPIDLWELKKLIEKLGAGHRLKYLINPAPAAPAELKDRDQQLLLDALRAEGNCHPQDSCDIMAALDWSDEQWDRAVTGLTKLGLVETGSTPDFWIALTKEGLGSINGPASSKEAAPMTTALALADFLEMEGIEPDDLDELVYDAADRFGSTPSVSTINNSGLEGQLEYLLGLGIKPAEILQQMDCLQPLSAELFPQSDFVVTSHLEGDRRQIIGGIAEITSGARTGQSGVILSHGPESGWVLIAIAG